MDLLTRAFSYENKSIVTDGTLETSQQRIGTSRRSLSESTDDLDAHTLGYIRSPQEGLTPTRVWRYFNKYPTRFFGG